jgi:hypothetical protein
LKQAAVLFASTVVLVAITVAKPVDIGAIHGRFEPELARKSLIMDAGGSGGRQAVELRTRDQADHYATRKSRTGLGSRSELAACSALKVDRVTVPRG